jgi:hypothetical protein
VSVSELAPGEFEGLVTALLAAFPTTHSLKEMLRFKLGKSLDALTEGALKQRCFQLVEASEAEGWTDDLVAGAQAHNPGNPRLADFFGRYRMSAQRSVPARALERLVNAGHGTFDPVRFREGLARVERVVCRIDAGNGAAGTGVLVGRNVVLTNDHVLGERPASSLRARFDYKLLQDGSVAPAHEHSVAACLERSSSDELDYAFLELGGAAADDAVVDGPRGCLAPPPKEPDLSGLLFIVQHPGGGPLKVAFDDVIAVSADARRVTYKVNTERGSSGSPILDRHWNFVALHHSGDPRDDRPAEYNEGIPIATIRAALGDTLGGKLGWKP